MTLWQIQARSVLSGDRSPKHRHVGSRPLHHTSGFEFVVWSCDSGWHLVNSLEGALLHLPSLILGIDQYINPSIDTAVTLLS